MRVRVLDADFTGLEVGTELHLIERRNRFAGQLVEWSAFKDGDETEFTILADWIDGIVCEQIPEAGDPVPVSEGGGI